MNKIVEEIKKIAHDKNALILAHNYQIPEIQNIADFTGDSLELAKKAVASDNSLIILCGVRFMAETATILAKGKKVIIPRIDAGCPMADMITKNDVIELRKQFPNAAVVTYINSSADVKTVSDIICTSSNAADIVNKIDKNEIIFLPDKNLGYFVSKKNR